VKKGILYALLIPAFAIMMSPAGADESAGLVAGNLSTAKVCGYGTGYIGGFVGAGEDVTSIFGSVTYGFSDYTDGRLRLGLADLDVPGADPRLMIGFDFKYQLMSYQDKISDYPFDLAAGLLLEYVNYEGASVSEVGGNIIGSVPFKLSTGQMVIPYSRLNFRLEHSGKSENNFRVGFNAGAKYEFNPDLGIYGELQIDGNSGLFLGLEIRAL